MKKKFLFLCGMALLLHFNTQAQAPEGINYQAVARNGSGNLIVSSVLNVRVTIYSGAGAATQVYQETHGVTTNQYGLFDLKIGKGAPQSGTFSAIDWSGNEHHVKVEIDNGSGFVDMGTAQLMSVPYALNAKTASSVPNLTLNDLADVNTTGVAASQVIKWNGTEWVVGNDNTGGSGGVNVGSTLTGDGTGTTPLDLAQQGATTGQVLSWNGTTWVPATVSSGGSYTAGTGIGISGTVISNTAPDQTITLNSGGATTVTGTYPNFTISSVDNNTTYTGGTGITLSGTSFSAQNTTAMWNANLLQGRTLASTAPATNEVLKWNGSQWAPAADAGGASYSAGTGLTLSGSTFSAQNTTAMWNANLLQGRTLASTAPATNEVLKWNGSQWAPAADAGGATYSAGTGLTLSGSTFSAQNTVAQWNANLLQGRTVASTAPTTNQVLSWNGTQWTPATPTSSPWTLSTGNVYRTSGNVGIGINSPVHRLHVVGTTTVRGALSEWSTQWTNADYTAAYYNITGGATANLDYTAATFKITGTNGFNHGLYGVSNGTSSGSNRGVTGYAVGGAVDNRGVLGVAEGTASTAQTYGVYGLAVGGGSEAIGDFSRGVLGNVIGSGYVHRGVQGSANGTASSSQGVAGFAVGVGDGSGTTSNYGVLGVASNSPDQNLGVYALATSTIAGTNFGIYASAANASSGNYAGYFEGDVFITGSISKASGTFKIDHPLDPANKYLVHSFVESPDMMNVYSGNITTDADGKAVVALPDYFQAANKDFRYQLTPIGQFAQLIVLTEIENNQFVVQSDKPNVKLSWTVIATRNDRYAQEHRIVDEVEKTGRESGKYIHPELYGASKEEGLYHFDEKNVLPEIGNVSKP